MSSRKPMNVNQQVGPSSPPGERPPNELPPNKLPANESMAGEEDPGAALDIEGGRAEDTASGLIESPMKGGTPAQREAHNFPDGGGSGGAEAFRVRKDLRGRSDLLGKDEHTETDE